MGHGDSLDGIACVHYVTPNVSNLSQPKYVMTSAEISILTSETHDCAEVGTPKGSRMELSL